MVPGGRQLLPQFLANCRLVVCQPGPVTRQTDRLALECDRAFGHQLILHEIGQLHVANRLARQLPRHARLERVLMVVLPNGIQSCIPSVCYHTRGKQTVGHRNDAIAGGCKNLRE